MELWINSVESSSCTVHPLDLPPAPLTMSTKHLLLPLAVLLLAILLGTAWISGGGDEPRTCFNLDTGRRPECFFSADYFQARSRFRDAVRDAGAELHSLPVFQDLTIDIGLFRATGTGPKAEEDAPKPVDGHSLLLHLSGTHGVEGFVGSAIQLSILKDPGAVQRTKDRAKAGTSVAFVHAVNPYGMAFLRRFNEANVDLNRNALFTPEQWKEVMGRPHNIAGYEDIDPIINPKGAPYPGQRLVTLLRAVWHILTRGFVRTKAALVTGTYQCESCVYFGGQELQSSHLVLREWLERHFLSDRRTPVTKLGLVDVHSGLGPLGQDTLMVSFPVTTENTTELFDRGDDPLLEFGLRPFEVSGLQDSEATGAASGYDLVVGGVTDNYPLLWGKEGLKRGVVSVTQEFGTVPGIWVALAVSEENQVWQLRRSGDSHQAILRDREAENLKRVFFPKSQRFQESVIVRGRSVFRQVLEWLAE